MSVDGGLYADCNDLTSYGFPTATYAVEMHIVPGNLCFAPVRHSVFQSELYTGARVPKDLPLSIFALLLERFGSVDRLCHRTVSFLARF
jgi:hypothetical protein